MVGRFQDGWLRVIWKGNKSGCAWEYGIRVGWMGKYMSVMWGWGGRDGVWRGTGCVCYLLEVTEGCSCQINIMQCTLQCVPCICFTRVDSSISKEKFTSPPKYLLVLQTMGETIFNQ